MGFSLEHAGFDRMLRLKGRNLKTAGGKRFIGTVNRIGAYSVDVGAGGHDPRGKRIMETPALNCPLINKGDKVYDVDNSEIYLAVEIGLDCPDYSKKFMLQQTAGTKDA